jgi:hypothetical protein
MKMVKSLILGSAAGLIAMGGAQAADLPVKAKPVEYVKICSLYGAGFFYIPGTDTCIKIGGYLRVDTTFNGSPYDEPAWAGDQGQHNRYQDYFASRSRMALTVDTRTATEYGVVRTFGRSASAYATPWHGYPGNNSSFLVGGHDTVTGTNNIQYTWQFGNGVSATLGLDDPEAFNRISIYNFSTTSAAGVLSLGSPAAQTISAIGLVGNSYAGVHEPDLVGNIRVDQAWGLFQVSGAVHEVDASFNRLTLSAANNFSEISGHPGSKVGGSAMVALQIKNIPWGAGDDIKMDASWAKGDMKNIIGTSAGVKQPFAIFGGGNGFSYQSIGFGAVADAVYLPVGVGGIGDGSLHLTEGWGFRGAYNHNWDPYWSSSLFGGFAAVRYDNTAKLFYCAAYVASNPGAKSADFSCNPDFTLSQIGFITRWTPVKNLTFSGEVMWFHLNQKFTGSSVLTPLAPKPVALYDYKDQDSVSLNLRVQRNF